MQSGLLPYKKIIDNIPLQVSRLFALYDIMIEGGIIN